MVQRRRKRKHIVSQRSFHTTYGVLNQSHTQRRSATQHTTVPASTATPGTHSEASQQIPTVSDIPTEHSSNTPEQPVQKKRKGPIRRAIESYKQSTFYTVWSKRPRYSYGAYLVVFFVVTEVMSMFQLWSVDEKYGYDKTLGTSLLAQVADSQYHNLASNQAIMNVIGMAMIYLVIVTVINRFWIGTAIFGTVMTIFAVANKIKIELRGEPVIPSDLSFLSGGGGDANAITSFVTKHQQNIIDQTVPLLIWFVAICLLLQFFDRRGPFIFCSWRHPFKHVKNIFGTICRIIAPIVSVSLLFAYSAGLTDGNSSTREMLKEFKYYPQLWNVLGDARGNGAVTTFLSLSNVKIMDKEPDYSEDTMRAIAQRYQHAAQEINNSRTQQLTDNTVIMVLSETFSDPTRVPGITLDTNPIPNIHNIKSNTTSGLMLSPGYGGGTANIEFQQMTGLNLALFNPTLSSPYQQLIPNRESMFTFNQMWNKGCGKDCSTAFHPYTHSLYLRGSNYKKFDFSNFFALDSKPPITHQGHIERNPYVSDSEAYANVLDEIRNNTSGKPQYIQLITMQNHTPYNNWYDNNEFYEANTSQGLEEGERSNIATFTKGLQYTDTSTADFLNQLNAIDKPITVVFYGDHLPGIYPTAQKDPKNALALHETDYFIWSNTATQQTRHIDSAQSAYTSSNYFMAQTADHLSAKVSPYLAFLTQLHQEIPAMARFPGPDGWTGGDVTMLNEQGTVIDPKSLSQQTKQLLDDYRMIQYDMCVGQNYLEDMGFMKLPE